MSACRILTSIACAFALSASAVAADLTPAQRADHRAKAETAARLVSYGRAAKNPAMLLSAVSLMGEVGPVADPAMGMKDGKPVAFDAAALLAEAVSLGADAKAAGMTTPQMTKTECSWFYNCTTDNVCWWDQWC